MDNKKIVYFDRRAEREFGKFPLYVREKAKALIFILSRDGTLIEPDGKKIGLNLFEIRIKTRGQWRLLYTYQILNRVIILSAFHKKSQQTPIKEIEKAKERMRGYK